jgi:very-short-patch-repair endonuclease
MPLCLCGCGKEVKQRYSKGHGRKGKKNTKEHNEAISKANFGRKASEQTLEKMRARTLTEEQKQHLRDINTGKVVSDETKRKMSKIAKQNGFGLWMKGRTPSAETIEKNRIASTGRVMSEEAKLSISEKNSGEKNGMYGKKHREDTILAIKNASIKHWETSRDEMLLIFNSKEHKAKLREARLKMVFPLKDTKPERTLARLFEELNIVFFQHFVVDLGKYSYQCDFYLPEMNLIIEADEIYWHKYPNLRPIDKLRNTCIINSGRKILRLWEHEIDKLNSALLLDIIWSLDKSCLSSVALTSPFLRFKDKYGIS